MTWYCTENRLGINTLATVNSTAEVTIGTVIRGKDSTYGVGEFIYVLAPGSVTAGLCATYNATTYQATLTPTDATGNSAPIGAFVGAPASGQYAWLQIGGLAVVKKTGVKISPASQMAVSGTAGRLYATYSTGKGILSAKSANLATVVSATSTVVVLFDRPSIEAI